MPAITYRAWPYKHSHHWREPPHVYTDPLCRVPPAVRVGQAIARANGGKLIQAISLGVVGGPECRHIIRVEVPRLWPRYLDLYVVIDSVYR